MRTTDLPTTHDSLLVRLKRRPTDGEPADPQPRRRIMSFKEFLLFQRGKRGLRDRSKQ